MKILKILFFSLMSACCGAGLMIGVFPLIAKYIVGPVHGEDQMSMNAAILFSGVPLCAISGAMVGGFYMRRHLNKKRQL
ncbi:hypothetical protein LU604_21690 [Erwinia tracheiphila]|uniref:MFS transporter n=1 Tax=Erwinia tracheiphila TaxID=65700 RepID=A0A345CXX6_9GAMM|nr:hypothetical protein [Erwinia tracheiphila]AXF78293.1 hypothetical protein AV903_23445 [Erwinia tracheiphila]UIA82980.1 hypothetical protein LU604_21690 [Erwinia tracheiphila]UIA91560.1 hypothetical protein LU632_21150 [Erwinia tracheiphila]